MFYSSKQLAKSLIQISKENPVQDLSSRFIKFCKRKNILSQLPNIVKHIELQTEKKKKENQLTIKINDKIENATIERIKKIAGSSAKTEIATDINPEIKGGFIAKYQGKIYDASIKTQLEKIKTKLTS